ncbi:sigma-70 family RNA polymerase sigma factor [Nocardioides solisilvae]|uniref:sigma-70 family RNA polymerase sigma factor n=1 Tax=Nocardioides solisilvae TaxID=1542435 RepID=UPI000D74558B|nr:sigma-70 family RNA polymerase sigma factor [Nocardioides solisilvae]
MLGRHDARAGLEELRRAALAALRPTLLPTLSPTGELRYAVPDGLLLAEAGPRLQAPARAGTAAAPDVPAPRGRGRTRPGDRDRATANEVDEAERERLIALVELARGGDAEAFGLLFDHYHRAVHRFLLHRTGSVTLAEDLTSETFFRALRSMQDFRWQGRDFGAWLTTIARNLAADHFKSGRTRLESSTDDLGPHEAALDRDRVVGGRDPGPEEAALASATHAVLLAALRSLPDDQRDCLALRFLQGMSLAEVGEVLGRSTGAVKQLQLRGLRTLARRLPAEMAEP